MAFTKVFVISVSKPSWVTKETDWISVSSRTCEGGGSRRTGQTLPEFSKIPVAASTDQRFTNAESLLITCGATCAIAAFNNTGGTGSGAGFAHDIISVEILAGWTLGHTLSQIQGPKMTGQTGVTGLPIGPAGKASAVAVDA